MRHYLKGDGTPANPPRQVVYHDQKDGHVRLIVPSAAAGGGNLRVLESDNNAVGDFGAELKDVAGTVYICDCGAAGAGQPLRRAAYRTIVLSSPNPDHYDQWQSYSRAQVQHAVVERRGGSCGRAPLT